MAKRNGPKRLVLRPSHRGLATRRVLLRCKPFEGTATQEFALKPQGDQTAVTWSMQGHNNSFIQKAFCLVMNGKKMIGDDLEKGLAQLKTVAESGKAAAAN